MIETHENDNIKFFLTAYFNFQDKKVFEIIYDIDFNNYVSLFNTDKYCCIP